MSESQFGFAVGYFAVGLVLCLAVTVPVWVKLKESWHWRATVMVLFVFLAWPAAMAFPALLGGRGDEK
jgi:predicted MFS family arabinose efflux permease